MTPELAVALVTKDEHSDYDSYEFLVEGADDGFVKHDITAYYSVVKDKRNGELWRINYQVSYNYGLDEHNIYFYPVIAKEVVTTVYTIKKD